MRTSSYYWGFNLIGGEMLWLIVLAGYVWGYNVCLIKKLMYFVNIDQNPMEAKLKIASNPKGRYAYFMAGFISKNRQAYDKVIHLFWSPK